MTRLQLGGTESATILGSMNVYKSHLLFVALGCFLGVVPFAAPAQERKDRVEELRASGYSVGSITPIYGQLVRFSYPTGFKHAHDKDSGTFYIQESVLNGETVQAWSQMVTVTGSKGLAANESVTPQRLAQQIASGFQRACPTTFAAGAIGALKVSGHDAFIALIGCGEVTSGTPRSEIAMLITIKGASDYYSIQWALRDKPLGRPPTLNGDEWLSRLKQLQPIKLCARIPGEQAPYPSCVDKKD